MPFCPTATAIHIKQVNVCVCVVYKEEENTKNKFKYIYKKKKGIHNGLPHFRARLHTSVATDNIPASKFDKSPTFPVPPRLRSITKHTHTHKPIEKERG